MLASPAAAEGRVEKERRRALAREWRRAKNSGFLDSFKRLQNLLVKRSPKVLYLIRQTRVPHYSVLLPPSDGASSLTVADLGGGRGRGTEARLLIGRRLEESGSPRSRRGRLGGFTCQFGLFSHFFLFFHYN